MATAQEGFDPSKVPEPGIARFLFSDKRMAWFWLIVRLYVGYQWLTAGVGKVFGISLDPSTFGQKSGESWLTSSDPGKAIAGFAGGAISKSGGSKPAVSDWYAWFLQNVVVPHATLFAYIISIGELLVGIGLILGLLTGIAAFFGLLMNVNYLLAGTVGTNPALAVLAALIMMAWRIAGYWGLDRWALPLLGVPGAPGRLFTSRGHAPPGEPDRPAEPGQATERVETTERTEPAQPSEPAQPAEPGEPAQPA